jgi:hypothetical protein
MLSKYIWEYYFLLIESIAFEYPKTFGIIYF